MKKKFTILIAALALLMMGVLPGRAVGQTRTTVTYKLTIDANDFNTTSYAANNNEKTSNAVCTTDNTKTFEVKWTSYQVMKNSTNMQWKKNEGKIYNSTNLGTITSVTVTKTAGTFTTYYGTSEQPSYGAQGAGKGFFKTSIGGALGTSSKLEVVFEIEEGGPTTYSVTYDANGATSGEVPTDGSTYESGAQVTVLGNTGDLAKTGYTWSGWNTQADGEGDNYIAGGTFNISKDTTLYAKWAPKTITGLSCTGTPTKLTYAAGESFDPTGLTVTATFNDNSDENVTSLVTWTPDPLTTGTTSVTGTYMNMSVNVEGLTVTVAPEWVLTDISELTADDIFVIVGTNSTGSFAMSNNNGTGSAPTATAVTISNNKITSTVSDIIKWNISGNGTDGYKFYPNGSTTTWLYCTSDNNGVRVGTTTGSNYDVFEIKSEYIYNKGRSAYLGIYSSQDWRRYTSINSNISGQSFGFYKYQIPTSVATPTFSVEAGTYNETKTVEITCTTSGATIYYTIDGTEPTTSSETYSSALNITQNTTLKAKAYYNSEWSNLASATYTLKPFTPTFTPEAGSYDEGQNITITSTTTGTTIYYTLDGTNPTPESIEYTGAINIITTTTVKAIAVKSNWDNSEVAEATYTINLPQVETPTFSPAGGFYTETQTVSIACTTADATIYYTTDGTAPTTSSSVYSTPLYISTTTTVKAMAMKSGMNNSEIATAEYTIPYTVAQALAADPQNGVYVSGIISDITEVNLSYHNATYKISDDGTHSGEMIVYRGKYLNNTNFTSADQIQVGDIVVVYGNLSVYQEVNQLAQNNYLVSLERPVKAATPTFSPVAGTYYAAQSVTIACETDGATIYYTTDGSNPTTESSVYGEAIAVSANATIKAFAVADGMNDSDIATAEYTIILTPSITVTPATANPSASDVEGSLDLTYANLTITGMDDFDIQYYDAGGDEADEPDWIEVLVAEQDPNIGEGYVVSYIMDANTVAEARTAYFKVYAMDGEEFVYSNLVTVTQAAFVVDYATLPFSFDGGKADIETTDGLTHTGLGSDYSSSPYLKFDTQDDNLVLKINEAPGELSFTIKGTGSPWTGTFNVQTSVDGQNYTDVATYTDDLGDTEKKTINNLASNVRYIRWYFTTKASGCNVGVGDINLAKDPASITLSTYAVEVDTGEHEGTINATYKYVDMESIDIYFCDANGDAASYGDWIQVDINSDDNVYYVIGANAGEARTAYFKVYSMDAQSELVYSDLVTVSQAGVAPATIYYHFNGTTSSVPTEKGEVELNTPTTAVNGYTFVGWTTEEISGVSESADYFMTYDVQGDIHFYAVLAIEETVENIEERTLTLTDENFNKTTTGSGYAAYNGEHLTDGVSYYTYQTMSYSGEHVIQMQTDKGYLYNTAPLDVNFIQLTVSAGSFTVYEGDESHPTSTEITQEDGVYTPTNTANKFFTIACGGATGKLSSIVINYNVQVPATIYTNFCTTVAEQTIPTTAGGEMTGDYTIPANQAFTITETIIIPKNVTLTVNGVLGNTDVTMLIIEDGGQLIHDDPVAATIQRYVNGYPSSKATGKSGYELIASPVISALNVATETNLTEGGEYDLYIFDQSKAQEEWRNYKKTPNPDFTSIENGKGYLYANSADVTISFSGTLKPSDENVEIVLDYEDGHPFTGWNLVGNPFACNAYAFDTIGKSLAFYKMNDAGDDFEAATGPIAPMEGIFVYASATGKTFEFTRTAPASVPGKGNLNLQIAQVVNNRDAQPDTDNAIVRFDGGNALEKFSFRDDNAKLYIPQNGKDYAVVSAEAQGEMPVYFKAAENGTYTISFSMDNVEFGYLHLIDNKTGNDVDLLQTPNYTFVASTIDYASRFRLVFRATGNDNDSENNDFGFFDANGNFLVLGIEGTATLQVMDVTGRILSTETFSGDYSKAINAKAGVYMLRLIQGSDVRTQKVVVK